MYDEIRQDLAREFKDFARHKVARWDLAIQGLLAESSTTGKPLSTSWLAHETGLSQQYISMVTTGRVKDPPSGKLIKIAEVFKISFPEFAMRAIEASSGSLWKAGFGQRGHIEYSQHGFSIQSLSPPGTGKRDFFLGIMTIKPLKELKRWQFPRHTKVALYVEQGTLELMYGTRNIRVVSNESVYFDGSVPHRLKNVDTFEAKLFLVTNPPLH